MVAFIVLELHLKGCFGVSIRHFVTETMAGAMEVIFFARSGAETNGEFTDTLAESLQKSDFFLEWLWRWCEIRRCFHTWPRVVTRSDSQWFSDEGFVSMPSGDGKQRLKLASEASAAAAALRRPVAWAKCQLKSEGTVRHFDQKWLKWASMIYWKWWVTVQFIAKVLRTLYRGRFFGEKLQLRVFVKRATSQIVFTCLGKPLVPSVLRSRLWARRHVMKEHLQRPAS